MKIKAMNSMTAVLKKSKTPMAKTDRPLDFVVSDPPGGLFGPVVVSMIPLLLSVVVTSGGAFEELSAVVYLLPVTITIKARRQNLTNAIFV